MSVLLLLLTLTIDEASLRAGESVNGFPSWEERVLHQWINRARVEPQVELANCGPACAERSCYSATAPLFWSESLNRAARFHADEMQKQGYFGHDSKCTIVDNINSLYPAGCDGSASCACSGGSLKCVSGGCTPWAGRIGLFGAGPEGEIIVTGRDPNTAFYLWLFERANASVCGFTGQNGHRWLILNASGVLGAGVAASSVVDFGNGTQASRIASAAHYPRQAESIEVWANWYHNSPPRSAFVIVDGKCTPLTLRRGSQTNGAWSATVTGMGSGCHRYYIVFTDASGAQVTWPATGSLGIGPQSCTDWSTSRSLGSCSTTTTPPKSKQRSVRR